MVDYYLTTIFTTELIITVINLTSKVLLDHDVIHL